MVKISVRIRVRLAFWDLRLKFSWGPKVALCSPKHATVLNSPKLSL